MLGDHVLQTEAVTNASVCLHISDHAQSILHGLRDTHMHSYCEGTTRLALHFLTTHEPESDKHHELHACCSKRLQEGSTGASSGIAARARATAIPQVRQLLHQLPQQAGGQAPLRPPTQPPPRPCLCWSSTLQKPGRLVPGGGQWEHPPVQPPS